MTFKTFVLLLLHLSLVLSKSTFCPEANHLYYRVRSKYRPEIEFHRLRDPQEFRIHDGAWFKFDSIGLTFLQFLPTGKESSVYPRYLSISLLSDNRQLKNTCFSHPKAFKSAVAGYLGFPDELDPSLLTPLCSSYAVTFKSLEQAQEQLSTINLDCQPRGYSGTILIHHVRYIVPEMNYDNGYVFQGSSNEYPNLPSLSRMFIEVREGKKLEYFTNFYSTRIVNPMFGLGTVPELILKQHQEASKEVTQIFTQRQPYTALFHPQTPDILHVQNNITRHVIIDHRVNKQLSSAYWNKQKWFKVVFHQIRIFGLYPERGMQINLRKIDAWSNEGESVNIVNILDNQSRSCKHGTKNKFNSKHSHEYMEYIDGHDDPDHQCDNEKFCHVIETKLFEIKYVLFKHSSKVSKDFIGFKSLDKTAGNLFSYAIWIRLKDENALKDGIYALEFINNQVRASKPGSNWNKIGRIVSLSNAFLISSGGKSEAYELGKDPIDMTVKSEYLFPPGYVETDKQNEVRRIRSHCKTQTTKRLGSSLSEDETKFVVPSRPNSRRNSHTFYPSTSSHGPVVLKSNMKQSTSVPDLFQSIDDDSSSDDDDEDDYAWPEGSQPVIKEEEEEDVDQKKASQETCPTITKPVINAIFEEPQLVGFVAEYNHMHPALFYEVPSSDSLQSLDKYLK